MITVESLLHARKLDPDTSHVAMSEVKPGKIVDFANAIHEMLDRHALLWTTDDPGADGPLRGLTDWQMTMLFMDIDNPTTLWLDPLRRTYPQMNGINTSGFIQKGRLWLSRNGYVVPAGVRRNKYINTAGERFSARRGTIWHRPASPVDPPVAAPTKTPCPHCCGSGVLTEGEDACSPAPR